MDVDTELFNLSVSVAPSGMNEIDEQTLERLNVVNNGSTRPAWTIESVKGQMYLKGERITEISGVNKFMLLCMSGKMELYIIFSAQGRDSELMRMPAHSLLIDGQRYRTNAKNKVVQDGLFRDFTTYPFEKSKRFERQSVSA